VAFDVHIGTVKFASQFKEFPCILVVTFPSFGSEGHGVQPPADGLQTFFSFLFSPERYFSFVLKRLNNELKENSITDERSVMFL